MNFGNMAAGLSATYPGMLQAQADQDAHALNALRLLASQQALQQQQQMFPLQLAGAKQALAAGGREYAGDVALGRAIQDVLRSELPGGYAVPQPPGTPSAPPPPQLSLPQQSLPPVLQGAPGGGPMMPPGASPGAGPGAPAPPPGPAAPAYEAPQAGLDWRAIATRVAQQTKDPVAVARAVDKLQKFMSVQATQEWRMLREELLSERAGMREAGMQGRFEAREAGTRERAAAREAGIQSRADTRAAEHARSLELRQQQVALQAQRFAQQGEQNLALRLVQIERGRDQVAIGSAAAYMKDPERRQLIDRANAFYDALEQQLRAGGVAPAPGAPQPGTPAPGPRTFNPATGRFY